MSKHHIGVTTKLKKEVVIELEFVAKEKGMKRSALIRECLVNFLITRARDEFLSPQKQNSPAA